MKILAVDDDQSIRELLPMILAEAGIEDITVACSASHALSMIETTADTRSAGPFDCFLLDIQMPGVSGITLCHEIRKLPLYHKTPVIMLTAMKEKSFIDDAFAAGATDYITKPFDIADVRARVRMAELLLREQHRVRDLLADADDPTKQSTVNPDNAFDDHLDLGSIRGLLKTQAFENYLAQLSRAGLASTSFYAVHVQNALQVFEHHAAAEFKYALRHVADAIIASQSAHKVIMCYVGCGNFICSSSASTMPLSEGVEWDVQNLMDEKNLTYDDGSPLDIELAVGATIQPLLTEKLQLEGLLSQAVQRAMVRVREKSAAPKSVAIRRFST